MAHHERPPEGASARVDAHALRTALKEHASAEHAEHHARFFKTGPGGYGEGDKFLGIRVPELRAVARQFRTLSLADTEELLRDPCHECRLTALFILIDRYKRGDAAQKNEVVTLYLNNLDWVNNWDLVDESAPKILGAALLAEYSGTGVPEVLWELARSGSLWRERIAMLATLAFIRSGIYTPTLELADRHLHHPHDLMHKAVGWMLREVDKRDGEAERSFLLKPGTAGAGDAPRYKTMPRTTLRYAIERFPEEERKRYLTGTA